MLLKLQFTEEEKTALSIVTGFFSNAAWFVVSINNINKAKQNFLYMKSVHQGHVPSPMNEKGTL